MREFSRLGDIRPHVRTEMLIEPGVMIPQRTDMHLHHQPILDAHARILHQHMGCENPGI